MWSCRDGFHDRLGDGLKPLSSYIWWAGVYLVAWFAVPLAVARRLGWSSRLGLTARGLAPKLWIYGLFYLVTLGFLVVAAGRQGFLELYPFLRAEVVPIWSWRWLLGFRVLYGLQFFCVEFFFRGFMIFSLEPRFGRASIAVMTVPYAMIHFDKPAAEALAAVVGGTILGWLAHDGLAGHAAQRQRVSGCVVRARAVSPSLERGYLVWRRRRCPAGECSPCNLKQAGRI